MNPASRWAAPVLMALAVGFDARAESALFLMNGPYWGKGSSVPEAYVVRVEDPALIAEARTHLAAGPQPTYLVPRVSLATGGSAENKNYAAPRNPAWGWHAAEALEWLEVDPTMARTTDYRWDRDSFPSEVSARLQAGMTEMYLVDFPLVMELSPTRPSGVSNLSTRGWVGTGERVLIGGFVVHGGAPRTVLIRGIGPSLVNFGIQEPLTDPTLAVFSGSEKIATNDDWQRGNLQRYIEKHGWAAVVPHPAAWMMPERESESALMLALPPGVYTVHLSGAGATEGIALIELYDLDIGDGE